MRAGLQHVSSSFGTFSVCLSLFSLDLNHDVEITRPHFTFFFSEHRQWAFLVAQW